MGSIRDPGPLDVWCMTTRSRCLAAADAALAKSGTTTLEAALADTPMVVAYLTTR